MGVTSNEVLKTISSYIEVFKNTYLKVDLFVYALQIPGYSGIIQIYKMVFKNHFINSASKYFCQKATWVYKIWLLCSCKYNTVSFVKVARPLMPRISRR